MIFHSYVSLCGWFNQCGFSLWFPWNVVSIKCSNFRLSQWSEKHVVDWIAVNGVHHWISITVGCSSKNIWRSLGRQSHFAVAFRLRENESYSKDFIAGWWFQTFGLLSISKMGCHPSHWLIFFKMAIAPPTSLVYSVYSPAAMRLFVGSLGSRRGM